MDFGDNNNWGREKNYKSTLHAFVDYLGMNGLNTDQVTSRLLNGFKEYLVIKHDQRILLLQKQGKRIPSNRTISLYMGSIRHLFNGAKKSIMITIKNIILIPILI